MGILNALNPMTWLNKAIDKRLYSKGVAQSMEYNPLLRNMEYVSPNKLFTRRMLENSTLYSGNEQDIAYFYRVEAPKFWRKNEPSESMNYFWARNNTDIRRIHSGIPQLISEKMVDLIVGNGFEIRVDEGDQELQEELDAILVDNKFRNLMNKGIETESWSGGVPMKLSIDTELSKYPIIEVWQPENYTNVVKCGRIQQDIFYTYYKRNNIHYRLSEIYGVDEKGSYIDYVLHMLEYRQQGQIKEEPQWVKVDLTTLDETKDYSRVTFEGYFKRLSLYKPNKLPNSEFRNSIYGESDYAGSYGALDAIDEILSSWIQEVRDGKLHRYFPEELMLKNSNGNYSYPDDFKINHILYQDSPSENTDKQKIQYEQGEVRADKYIESYKIWLTNVLNNAGFSPLTVGVTGLESIDASAQSQQEREKVSIRTRNKKIELWQEYLQDFLQTALEVHMMTKSATQREDGAWNIGNVPEFSIIASFNDYIIKSKADRTTEVSVGMGTSWNVLEGVKYVHSEKPEKEQLAISALIKLENGMQSITQAEASALQAMNMELVDQMKDEGVEIVEGQENDDGLDIEENDIVPPTEDNDET